MKKILLFHSSNRNEASTMFDEAYCKESTQLLGFKEVTYQDIVFDVAVDGELYNSSQVQETLSKENFPIAKSLEELFLYAYLLWGEQAMKELEGAYSFTIKKGESIITIKDPMGLKPIFYLQNEQGYWLSNRLDTLLSYSLEPAILDQEGVTLLFAFGPGIPEEKTLFKNIHALPMGSLVSYRNDILSTKRYYNIPLRVHEDDLETTVKKVHDLVERSILQQLPGCGASFLSGGLDSSIITSVCAKHRDSWNTYSLDYEGNDENFKGNLFQVSLDRDFIEDMLAYCNSHHTKLTLTQKELCELLEEAMIARDMPGMADVDSSLLWLCRQVAKKEECILSGECSDELMGGYPWFYREEFKEINTFPWLRYSEQRIELLNKNLRNLDYQKTIDAYYEDSLKEIEFLESDSEEDKRARINTTLVLHWFMQTLVTRQVCEGDRADVNIRAPFANVKLLEYVYNIPWSMKFLDEEEKGILRKAFEDELPQSVAHRKKNPFPKTHNPEYASRIAKKLKQRFDDPNSALHQLFDDVKLKELIESEGASYPLPFYGQLMSGPQLLAYIYQIDCWIQDYHVELQL